MNNIMNSLQRTLTALSHKEPDKVPLFLLLSISGAKFTPSFKSDKGCSIKDYFSDAEQVAQAQMAMLERYQHDCLYSFYYASAELEAFGGETLYFDDGPPNAGAPIIRSVKDIADLSVPVPQEIPVLQRILKTQQLLKQQAGDNVPIIGVAISPFSMPVMQMGFEGYLDLMYKDQDSFNKLMKINEAFCVTWANAQFEAGATAICYFDPVSSTSMIPREKYLQSGQTIAKRVLAQINGPIATHMASGRCLPIVDDIAETGTAILGVSTLEDIRDLKQKSAGKITLLGNLNAVEMRRWTAEQVETEVKKAIAGAARGGGFLLAENHGEIPWQVPDKVLMAISEAVQRWGQYPLDWIDDDAG
ncbi:MAG: uroporphyrinogen decarboxylase family protein [gamma proteobacterium symbiont of Taylorina sp.]|nr:uroporphyrinogen decarboxylase family protein [gamma proteobacterium symbiont of Taylorina sp.]